MHNNFNNMLLIAGIIISVVGSVLCITEES